MDVVAIGEVLIDFTCNGTSAQGNDIYEANPGGAPGNVLAMLQKLGNSTAFIGKVGDDAFGRQLADVLRRQNINIDGLVFDAEVPTTLAFVHTKPDGDRSFSFYRNPGADMMLRKQEINVELIQTARIFHFGSLSMTTPDSEAVTKYAIDIAQKAGAIISFDPNLRESLWEDLETAKQKIAYGLSVCDVLKISDHEIAFMTQESDITKGVHKIQNQYRIPFVCATMGKEGSKAFYRGLEVEGAPYYSADTIETTGAGDTFCANFLHFILEHGLEELSYDEIAAMLDFANAAACIITTKRGALRVMPSREEIRAFQNRNSRR